MQQKDLSTITGPSSSECSSKAPPFKTIKALFAAMPSGMNPEAADGMDAVVQFHLTGSESMDGHLIIKEGGCSYSDGVHPNPTTSIRSDSELWLAISNNETSGEEAYLHQQYTVEGDMTILLKFNQLFAWAKVEDPCESIPAYKNEYDYHAFQPGQINRIVIFDGGPRDTGLSKTAFMVDHFCSGARSAGAEVEHVKLKDMSIHPCMGCYTCWTKTPGECVYKDDMTELLKKIRMADLLIMASPLFVFSVTGIMKNFLDRLIPIKLPYMQIHNKVTGHPHRYADDRQQGFVVFSAAGFPEVMHNFDGLKALFRCLSSHTDKSSLMGEFFLPASEVFAHPVYGERRERVAKACRAAGVQVVTEGKIDPAFMDAVSNAEISQEKFKALANAYWETMDGNASYHKSAPKLDYSTAVA